MPTSIALAMPAFNEADGIGGFLLDVDAAFGDWDGDVWVVVANDCSTDRTLEVLEEVRSGLHANLVVVTTAANAGHGPTVLRAYNEALDTGADVVLQVDGDGQFLASDIRRVAADLVYSGASVTMGRRRTREDPWFRRVLTRSLQVFLRQRTGLSVGDANCPLRAYRSRELRSLLAHIPPDAAVPNVYLAVLAHVGGLRVTEVIVEHRKRRGEIDQGTMWGKRQRKVLVPRRLVVFVRAALGETRRFLHDLDVAAVRSGLAAATSTR